MWFYAGGSLKFTKQCLILFKMTQWFSGTTGVSTITLGNCQFFQEKGTSDNHDYSGGG
jgi:hypothetical protein